VRVCFWQYAYVLIPQLLFHQAAVGISLGVMAGAPVGGVLFAAGGKRLPFLVVAGVLVFDALARVVLLAEPDEVHHALEQSQKEGGLALQDASQGGSALFREDVGAQERGTLQSGAGEANVEDGAHGTTRHRATSVVDPEGGGGAQDHTPAACDSDVEQGVDDEKKEKKAEDQRPALVVLKELCCDPQVVVITLVLLCGNGCIGFAEAQLPRYLEETFDLGSLTIGLIYGAQTMLFTIVMPILAARGAAIGRPFLMALGLVVMGACITLVPWWKNLVWVIPIWMGTAVGMACIDSSCNPQLADIVESRHPGSCVGGCCVQCDAGSLTFEHDGCLDQVRQSVCSCQHRDVIGVHSLSHCRRVHRRPLWIRCCGAFHQLGPVGVCPSRAGRVSRRLLLRRACESPAFGGGGGGGGRGGAWW